tara:strand:- start:1829 stop:2242 length:414 start_codon:yes stop_codon:yes gene_type:complete
VVGEASIRITPAITQFEEKNMDSQRDATENLGSSRCSVAYWSDALEVVEAMQQEEPQIHFMDGHSLTGREAWNKCLRVVLQRLQAKADKATKNTVAIRMLPWICGECGKHEVQNLRVYEGGPSFIATCDHCGAEWVS